MDKLQQLSDSLNWFIPVIILLVIWELIWKSIAMWKAARNNQLNWFICLALISTIGILPIAYLLRQRKNNGESSE